MNLYYESDLYHHGIKGQKWGDRNGPPYPLDSGQKSSAETDRKVGSTINVKKSENSSGGKNSAKSETGSKENEESEAAEKKKTKKISEMTDEELRAAISRVQLEQQYRQLTYKPSIKTQMANQAKKVVSDVITQSATTVGKKLLTDMLNNVTDAALGKMLKDTGNESKDSKSDDKSKSDESSGSSKKKKNKNKNKDTSSTSTDNSSESKTSSDTSSESSSSNSSSKTTSTKSSSAGYDFASKMANTLVSEFLYRTNTSTELKPFT